MGDKVPIDEARTIRELVRPALAAAGWTGESLTSEFPITAGARIVANGRVRRGERLFADLALMRMDANGVVSHPLSVLEAKRSIHDERRGIQQAKDYGHRLDLPLVYATNGRKIIEIDLAGGTQHEVERYRTPEQLWNNFCAVRELSELGVRLFEVPYSRAVQSGMSVKQPRYYQHVAIQRILQAIAGGDRRILTVLATGTGKSFTAAQLVHSLWQSRWPRGPRAADPRPRVLYVADRDVLVNDPMVREFQPIFGEEEAVRVLGATQTQARINFASYQALDSGDLFRQYDADWFDLVVIDECHRGSASANSQWREILEHFSSAVHLGMTATPRSDGEADTFEYFGEPSYEYSLRQGIEDGFLAPFEVVRVLLSTDVDGVRIAQGVVDEDGADVPARTYTVRQLERRLIIPERTQEAAGWVSRHLAAQVRGVAPSMGKTIVFCVDQNHAARFTEAIGNLNPDLMVQHDSIWATRITSDEGERGKALLARFQNPAEVVPVVVSSSDMLTTGVDAPTVRCVVFFTPVTSMTRFKQMVGRGTRLAEDDGKEYFTIVDFTGVSQLFEDRTFDGMPIRAVELAVDEPVDAITEIEIVDAVTEVDPEHGEGDDDPLVAEPSTEFVVESGGDFDDADPDDRDGAIVDDDEAEDDIRRRAVKHVVHGLDVWVLADYLYVVEPAADFRLRSVRIETWAQERILDLGYDEQSLRKQWADSAARRAVNVALRERLPFTLDELAVRLGYGNSDPFDVLLKLAYDVPLRSRGERLAQFTRRERAFLDGFAPEAREIIDMILDKYDDHGPADLEPGVLTVPPLSELGSVTELAGRFGAPGEFRAVLDDLCRRLYRAS